MSRFISRVVLQLRGNPALIRTILVGLFATAAAYGFNIPNPVQDTVVTIATLLIAAVGIGTSVPGAQVAAQETTDGETVAGEATAAAPEGEAVTVEPVVVDPDELGT